MTSAPVDIRPLTVAEQAEFTALRIRGAQLFPAAFLLSAAELAQQDAETVRDLLASGRYLGAFAGSELVGIGGLNPHRLTRTRHRAELGPFFVVPEQQGAGIAAHLMQAMFDFARNKGILQLELWVAAENTRARAFYKRMGFAEAGQLPRALLDGNGAVDDVLMVRALDATPARS